MEDMFDFQNMDVSMELDSLEVGFEFDEVNILEGLPSPSPSDHLHFGAVSPNFPNEQEQPRGAEVEPYSSVRESGGSGNKEAAALATSNNQDAELADRGVAGYSGADNNGRRRVSVSDTLTAIAVSQVLVDPIADFVSPRHQLPLLRPSPPYSPSALVLGALVSISQGTAPSFETKLNDPAPDLLSSQNENMHMPRGMDLPNEHNTNNQMVEQNVVAHSASAGINEQQYPSYTSLILTNPADTRVGVRSATLNQGQFTSNQQPPTTCNSSWSQYHQRPSANVLGYDTSIILRPHQFNPLSQQGSHVPVLQNIFDVQNCLQPPFLTFSRLESCSNYQSIIAPLRPNTYDHQHVHRPMLPERAVSIGPTMYPNFHPQPGSSAMTFNSFGAGPSSMAQRYPDLYDYQRNYFHSQPMMAHGFAQQAPGSAQVSGLRSPLVSDDRNILSQLWSRPNVQGQSSTFHGPPILPRISGSNVQSTMIVEPSRLEDASNASLLGFRTPEISRLSWTPNSSTIQLQNVASASTNTFATNLDRGKFVNPPPCSRPQISDRVRRILSMSSNKPKGYKPKAASSSGQKAGSSRNSAPHTNSHQIETPNFHDPEEKWIKEFEMELNRAWNQPDSLTKIQVAPRNGRGSSEGRGIGESSSSSSKRRKVKSDSAGKDNEARNTSENEVNEAQEANASEPSASREFVNSAYDLNFEKMGIPIDPHIRFFRIADK